MKNPVVIALLGINAALAAGLAAMWVNPQGHVRAVHWQPPVPVTADYTQMVPNLPSASLVRGDVSGTLLERPLFSMTRRPPSPPPVAAAEPVADTLSSARLLGIFEAGASSSAIVFVDGKSRRIKLNEAIGGWRLHAVHERAVVFVSPTGNRTLPLTKAPADASSAPTPSAAQSGRAGQGGSPAAASQRRSTGR